MRSNYGQKSLLVAVQSVKDHICVTKPFLLKMGSEISGWRFLKFWFFYAGFYCITRTLFTMNIVRAYISKLEQTLGF